MRLAVPFVASLALFVVFPATATILEANPQAPHGAGSGNAGVMVNVEVFDGLPLWSISWDVHMRAPPPNSARHPEVIPMKPSPFPVPSYSTVVAPTHW